MTGQFDQFLNWKLLRGPHEFPGPDGGTCINEAAVIAAGFPYRKVRTVEDCPPCFSKPLSAYAMTINDTMADHERSALMPFVVRLAGTADSPNVEMDRANTILVQVSSRLYPKLLRGAGHCAEAELFELCNDINDLRRLRALILALSEKMTFPGTLSKFATCQRFAVTASANLNGAIRNRVPWLRACASAEVIPSVANAMVVDRDEIWRIALDILDAACRIGRQPDPMAGPLIQERMDSARVTHRALEPA